MFGGAHIVFALSVQVFPFSLALKPWRMGQTFVKNCKVGVHNYVSIPPFRG